MSFSHIPKKRKIQPDADGTLSDFVPVPTATSATGAASYLLTDEQSSSSSTSAAPKYVPYPWLRLPLPYAHHVSRWHLHKRAWYMSPCAWFTPRARSHILWYRGFAAPRPTLPEPGAFSVLKFGGSSVGSPVKLNQVLDTVAEWLEQRRSSMLSVVVSAQGNTTDWLLDAADFAAGKYAVLLMCAGVRH